MPTAATQHRSQFLAPCLVLLFLAWPLRACAQSPATPAPGEAPLNLSQLLENLFQKNAERAEALQKYQGTRVYNLDYKGFPTSFHAEMTVDVTYDAPATKKFKIISQSGSQWIIDKVLKRLLDAETEAMSDENRARIALTSRNYIFSELRYEDAADNCSYSVALEPRIPSKLLYRGRIWVDSRDFAVCRIEAEPSKNPSFWIKKTEIHHSYLKIADFWLPAKNESVSAVRGGGRAVLTIRYQSYEIQAARPLKTGDTPQPRS
jgi:outer membrane lipoprotein-sorting protein